MDNLSAKEILSAYRANGADAQDPLFREALDQCRHDPSLQSWLRDQQAFDSRMSARLKSFCAPDSEKEALLATLPLTRPPSFWQRSVRRMFPLAAALILGLGLLVYRARAPDLTWETGSLSVSSLSRASRSLDYRAEDALSMNAWLVEQGAPVPESLPLLLQEAVGNGCKLFDDGRDNVISMLCFTIGNELVHVFVFDEHTRHYVDLNAERWQNERGWHLRALPQGDLLLAVATRGDTGALASLW